MRLLRPISYILSALAILFFTACDTETLEGDFPQNEEIDLEEGQFVAAINDQSFAAANASAVLTTSNVLTITGINPNTGASIQIRVEDASISTFNLTANPSTQNRARYFEGPESTNPYVSEGVFGGFGQMNLTEIIEDPQTISGNFTFEGVRQATDDDGNPLEDGAGNPILETVTVTQGAFLKIPYTIEDDNDDDDDDDDQNPTDVFFANVDGEEFVETTLTTTLYEVGMKPIIKIEAQTDAGELLRIDIPEGLGIGTFDMVQLSDGTQLIGIYNDGQGGTNLTSNPGTITITEFGTLTGRIVGTFSFTGTDPLEEDPAVVEVTEGSFAVSYEATASPSIRGSVDGMPFETTAISFDEIPFGGNLYTIVSADFEDQRVILTYNRQLEEGEYIMSTGFVEEMDVFATYIPDTTEEEPIEYYSNPGSFSISNYSASTDIIEGNFSFTADQPENEDSLQFEITNGQFALELPPAD
ncbi:DUF6252 family protein [Flavobacteriaceae bacterium TK19130]|nr:DUF6252 family protein [Thermobacterium salinum]